MKEKGFMTLTPDISNMVISIPSDPITVVILFFTSVDISDFKAF
jgi:hypothetical protein